MKIFTPVNSGSMITSVTKPHLPPIVSYSKAIVLLFLALFLSINAKTQTTTVNSPVTASSLAGINGTLFINSTVTLSGGDVSWNFSTVIINEPNGKLFWGDNSDLHLIASVTFSINNPSGSTTVGLQPTGGSASKLLWVGTTKIAASNDASSNAAFSFEEFNEAGGLPQFVLSTSSSTVCGTGTSFTATITPLNNTIDYDCNWSISPGSATLSSNTSNNFNTPQTITITPSALTTYTVSCTLKHDGDSDPIVTKTKTVTVVALPSTPTSVSATPLSICSGASSNLKATSAGNTIEWYTVSSGGSPVGTSASATDFAVSPASTTTYYAGALTAGGCRSASRAAGVTVTVTPNSWLGNNSNWDDISNWCSGTVPTSTTDVSFANGLGAYPVITSTAYCRDITIATGGTASVTVNGSTLKIAGAISSTNDITATAGTIEMNGTAAQSIRADHFSSATISELIISNTLAGASSVSPSVQIAAAGGMFNLTGKLSFGNLDNAYLNTNDNLTLLSSAAGTANIADLTNNDVNSGNTITGKVVIERYIPGNRAWRLLTAPVTAASNVKISDAWQDGAPPVTDINDINSTNDPNPGYGTHVTYGKPAANGYDQGINGNPSIYQFTATGWNGIPAVTNAGNITNQPAYMLFVRGDRGTLLSLATVAPLSNTILRPKGSINQGLMNIPLGVTQSAGGSNFRVIGNPYPSAINYHKIATLAANSSASIPDAFYLWDPNITGSNGVGGWIGLSYNSGSYDRTVLFDNSSNSSINNNGDIQSGSGFVIDYNGVSSTIQIKESSKVNVSNITQFRPSGRIVSQIRTTLFAKNADNTISVNDAVLSTFDKSFADAVDSRDLRKLNNFSENLSLKRWEQALAIERRQPVHDFDTISYTLKNLKLKAYQLKIDFENIKLPKGSIAVLEDTYLGSSTKINPVNGILYDFSVSTDAASYAAGRFSLIFHPSVIYTKVTASRQKDDVAVKWDVTGQAFVKQYEIERSTDGINFKHAGTVVSRKDNTDAYTWTDTQPAAGNYFYRVAGVTGVSEPLYSKPAKISIINEQHKMPFVYPNPVTGNKVSIHFNKIMPPGVYKLNLTDINGRPVSFKVFKYSGNDATFTFNPSVKLTTGNYLVEIIRPDKKTNRLKILVAGE